MTSLLFTRRFGPLFIAQFLGALNDNFFKNAVLLFILYRLAEPAGLNGGLLMPVGAGLFMLPCFLFSATAGQLADHFDKARLIRLTKALEVVFMTLCAGTILLHSIWGMMAGLFLMGIQLALFSPLKLAILPELLDETEVLAGNGLIEAGTFLAILIGTIGGGLLVTGDNGPMLVSACMIVFALLGWGAAHKVPSTGIHCAEVRIGANIAAQTWDVLKYAQQHRGVFNAILGISWFWGIGAIFLTEFPDLAKSTFGGDAHLVTLFMAMFTIGVGAGSIGCARLLKNKVSLKLVPMAALGLALFSIDFSFACYGVTPAPGGTSIGRFITSRHGLHILCDLLAISGAGGVYAVSLYTYIQMKTETSHRARIIGATNVLNALFMVAGSVAVTGMLAHGYSIPDIFLALGGATILVAFSLRQSFKPVSSPQR